MFIVATMFLGGCGQKPSIDIPSIDLDSAYPEVAEFITRCRTDVEEEPGNPEAWGKFAMALDAHEFDDAAGACYRQAIRLAPDKISWKYLSAANISANDPGEALSLLQSIPIADRTLPVLLKLRELLETTGDIAGANSIEKHLNDMAADHPAVLVVKLRRLVREANWDAATRTLFSFSGRYSESERLRLKIAAATGSEPQAGVPAGLPSVATTVRDPYLGSVMSCRRDPLYRGMVAGTLAAEGSEIAFLNLAKLVKQHPELVDNRAQFAILLSERGMPGEALQEVTAGLVLQPGNVKLLTTRAAIQLQLEDWMAAVETLQDVVQTEPGHAAAWADLGFCFEQLGRTEDAKHAYRTSLELDPSDTDLEERLQSIM